MTNNERGNIIDRCRADMIKDKAEGKLTSISFSNRCIAKIKEDRAIEKAYWAKKNKLIEKKITQAKLFQFSGNDKCINCPGWNGSDHICLCGKTRIDWKFTDDETDVYPEPY